MKKTILTAVIMLAVCGLAGAQGFTTLGIGISNPQGTLHVHNPSIIPDKSDSTSSGMIENEEGDEQPRILSSISSIHLTTGLTGTSLTDGFLIECNDFTTTLHQKENAQLKLKNHSTELILTTNGRIGVGATNSSSTFNVEGTARIASSLIVVGSLTAGSGFFCAADGALKVKSLRVTTTAWPDYVFGGGHKLMPLQEVEDYIEAHGHLPEIPSAEEAEVDGVDLGEMNKLLLQKVEELTLYVIDLQKQVEELKSNK